MGNSYYNQEPRKAYRILKIEEGSPASQANLNVLVDYVMQPEPHAISLNQTDVQLQVYSLVDQNIRSVNVHLNGRSLGMVVRHEPIDECILKVVNVIKGSPVEKHGLKTNEDYIIGMVEHSYMSLKGFIGVIRQQIEQEDTSVTIGVFNNQKGLRLVKIQVKELLAWRTKGRGILGCELAEGWANRISKPHIKAPPSPAPQLKQKQENPTNQQQPSSDHLEQATSPQQQIREDVDEFESKIGSLLPDLPTEAKFKGLLRCEQAEDASSFCKCQPPSKWCQQCSYKKEGVNYFYCKKISRIVGLPDRMLFVE